MQPVTQNPHRDNVLSFGTVCPQHLVSASSVIFPFHRKSLTQIFPWAHIRKHVSCLCGIIRGFAERGIWVQCNGSVLLAGGAARVEGNFTQAGGTIRFDSCRADSSGPCQLTILILPNLWREPFPAARTRDSYPKIFASKEMRPAPLGCRVDTMTCLWNSELQARSISTRHHKQFVGTSLVERLGVLVQQQAAYNKPLQIATLLGPARLP